MSHGYEILLVEDNPDDAELTLRALAGVLPVERVLHVEDGASALEVLLEDDQAIALPRVVLLDLELPGIDGYRVLKRLRAEQRTRFLPVVALSGFEDENKIAASYAAGANSYVVKSANFVAYLAAVESAARYWTALNQVPWSTGRASSVRPVTGDMRMRDALSRS